MYLHNLFIRNYGALHSLTIEALFTDDGTPVPIVLVGGNGSGKTSCLSAVGDALFEAAANHFTNAVANQQSTSRPYFRVVGSSTVTVGTSGSLTMMRFKESDQEFFFREKGGAVKPEEVAEVLPSVFTGKTGWTDEALKDFAIPPPLVKSMFLSGVYAYFPSSRSEHPHWLNRAAQDADFDNTERFEGILNKPIFIERGIDRLQSWLMNLMLEARSDFDIVLENGNAALKVDPSSLGPAFGAKAVLGAINQILRAIIGRDDVRFTWSGRGALHKLSISDGSGLVIPSLRGLSAGQSTLLSMFGSILQYADMGTPALNLAQISGICVIDEIDAHMHVSLQREAIPKLIQMFPKVQFIISAHSPLCVLGLERLLTPEKVCILDMPSGTRIDAERYEEFEQAFKALKDSQAFQAEVQSAMAGSSKLLVLLEGETDPRYMKRAVEMLGMTDIGEKADFEWIGAKDATSGQGYATGKGALTQASKILKANPGFIKRPVLLLYDNDTNVSTDDSGDLHIRSMPTNDANTIVKAGIENLLPEELITDVMYETKTDRKPNGSETTIKTLRKMQLCESVCTTATAAQFAAFGPVLEVVRQLLPAIH